jgi:hypothetical protein
MVQDSRSASYPGAAIASSRSPPTISDPLIFLLVEGQPLKRCAFECDDTRSWPKSRWASIGRLLMTVIPVAP